MDALEADMVVQDIVELHLLDGIVFLAQGLHTFVDITGLHRFLSTHLIGKPFVVAYGKPRFVTVGGIRLEYCVQLLDVRFRYLVHCMVNDIVNTTEMIDGLHDVIHGCALSGNAKRVGLEDKTRLLLCQTATLHVV